MSKGLLEQLLDTIERDLPDWKWLIRADKEHGYFANMIREATTKSLPGNEGVMLAVPSYKCPHYAPTREGALMAAYLDALDHQNALNEAALVSDMVVDGIARFFGMTEGDVQVIDVDLAGRGNYASPAGLGIEKVMLDGRQLFPRRQ